MPVIYMCISYHVMDSFFRYHTVVDFPCVQNKYNSEIGNFFLIWTVLNYRCYSRDKFEIPIQTVEFMNSLLHDYPSLSWVTSQLLRWFLQKLLILPLVIIAPALAGTLVCSCSFGSQISYVLFPFQNSFADDLRCRNVEPVYRLTCKLQIVFYHFDLYLVF